METIAIPGGELTCEIAGQGVALAMIHQYTAVSAGDLLARTLTPLFRVHAINPRGLAGSGPVRDRRDLSMAAFAEQLHEARDALGIASWVVAGASTGGMVALLHALQDPSAISALVLIGTAPSHRFLQDSLYAPGHPRAAELARARPLALGDAADQARFADIVFRLSVADPEATPVPPGWAEPEVSMPRMMAFSEELSGFDLGPRLEGIACPTLVMVGRHDPQCPPAHSREIAGRLPRARLAVFERSGHFPYLEERDAFEAVLAEWARDHGLG
ncbi:alpha/beta hydrolase [Nonomuraea sp. NPDC049709]|uniref:alpha/beta fold hydrolase n=1 Tax=Nonomuraea sp. NPDC049709 TaxID=3154736 RepID=UPI003420030D